MRYRKTLLMSLAVFSICNLAGCSDGEDGKSGIDGINGQDGATGEAGLSAGEFVNTIESAADLNISLEPSDITVTGSEPFALKFKVTGKNTKNESVPFTGLDKISLMVAYQTENNTGSGSPYLWTNQVKMNDPSSSYMYCTPEGKTHARTGGEVNACTLVEDSSTPGTYIGSWKHDGTAPALLQNGDANKLYRVVIRAYNIVNSSGIAIADKILSSPLDFIPATNEHAQSMKDSVSNSACISCHSGMPSFEEEDKRIANIGAHHNFQKVENCVICHNPDIAGGQNQPEKGYNANFAPMVHTIHAGARLAEWGQLTGEALNMFGEVGFPSQLNDCVSCHDGTQSWNENIYAEACVGCHAGINFETGVGHSEFNLAQADDSQCNSCHGAGDLSPAIAHKVGSRSKLADKFKLDFQSAIVKDNGINDGMSTLTVTSKLTINGAIPANDISLKDYIDPEMSPSKLLIGNLDTEGNATGGMKMSIIDDADSLSNGLLVVSKEFEDARLTGTIYVTSDILVCGSGEQIIKCNPEGHNYGIAADGKVKYFNLDSNTVSTTKSRLEDMARITVSEDKCNACHENLTHVKEPRHGVTEFTQCMDCHNERAPGSHAPAAQYKTNDIDADGKAIWKAVEALSFSQHDLATVAHRFHSGLWREANVYRDADGALHGYPAIETQCNACHKDNTSLFNDKGELVSGRRSIQVSADEYISPVAEACRTCHAHSDAAALAHFKSNGATVQGSPDTTANLPVESCATCHAEGRRYGIDSVHMTSNNH